MTNRTPEQHDRRQGYLYAAGAFGWWAFIVPSYFRLLSHHGALPLEVLAQRVVFGIPLLIVILMISKRIPDLIRACSSWSSLKILIPSTGLIAINWFFFIYAVSTDRLNHASLGYYINPLFSIFLGYLFLGEKLSKLQGLAILIAAGAVAMMTVAEFDSGGGVPWIAILLPASFGLYGLLRKQANVTGTVGISFEMLVLLPFCIGLMIWLEQSDKGIFFATSTPIWVSWIMFLGGVITIVPLICFTNAVRLLPLSTVGLLQFSAPTGQLLLSAVFFDEPFPPLKFAAFVLIWIAIGVFIRDLLNTNKARRDSERAIAEQEEKAEHACVDTEMLE
ncbi:MAG: EamA family transporter RarD [Phycisphaerales bacterium]|nr:EamA family transporter RarD [Phycisphaerales bacterium]